MIREIEHDGRPLYFLADDLGAPWAGGWWSRETAEAAEATQEERGWDGLDLPAADIEIDEQGRPQE